MKSTYFQNFDICVTVLSKDACDPCNSEKLGSYVEANGLPKLQNSVPRNTENVTQGILLIQRILIYYREFHTLDMARENLADREGVGSTLPSHIVHCI